MEAWPPSRAASDQATEESLYFGAAVFGEEADDETAE
jgi:hypothetical protein